MITNESLLPGNVGNNLDKITFLSAKARAMLTPDSSLSRVSESKGRSLCSRATSFLFLYLENFSCLATSKILRFEIINHYTVLRNKRPVTESPPSPSLACWRRQVERGMKDLI